MSVHGAARIGKDFFLNFDNGHNLQKSLRCSID